jgi:thymidine phosphorylase
VLDLLCGRGGCARLRELTLALAGELLCLGGLASDGDEADRRLRQALDSGAAAERFARMVAALGGPSDLLERPDAHLALAPVQLAVLSATGGYVSALDVRALGEVVVELGGGRKFPGQPIDHSVGLAAVLARGGRVEAGQPLAIVHARSEADAQRAADSVRRAMLIAEAAPAAVPLMHWHQPMAELA